MYADDHRINSGGLLERFSSNLQTTLLLFPLNLSNCDIPLRFAMPGPRMKVSRPISPILTLKLVAMATDLERPKKNVRSLIYHQILTIGLR